MGAGACKSRSATQVRPQQVPTAWGATGGNTTSQGPQTPVAPGLEHLTATSPFPSIFVFGLSGSGKSTLVSWMRSCGSGGQSLAHCQGQFTHNLPSRPAGMLGVGCSGSPSSPLCLPQLVQFSEGQYHVVDSSGWLPHRKCWAGQAEAAADGVIFCVDASDHLRLPLAWCELVGLLHQAPRVRSVPLLVCLNKVDDRRAVRTAALRQAMGAVFPASLPHTSWCIAEMSLRTGEGVRNALQWLLPRCCRQKQIPASDPNHTQQLPPLLTADGNNNNNTTAFTAAVSDVSVLGASTIR